MPSDVDGGMAQPFTIAAFITGHCPFIKKGANNIMNMPQIGFMNWISFFAPVFFIVAAIAKQN